MSYDNRMYLLCRYMSLLKVVLAFRSLIPSQGSHRSCFDRTSLRIPVCMAFTTASSFMLLR